jgi:hypothetical protein
MHACMQTVLLILILLEFNIGVKTENSDDLLAQGTCIVGAKCYTSGWYYHMYH